MRSASGTEMWHLLAAVRTVHAEIQALRKDIDELRDDVKVGGGGGINGLQMILNAYQNQDEGEGEDDASDSSSECASVQSAPATVSYERE
jgi:hypothetical protein